MSQRGAPGPPHEESRLRSDPLCLAALAAGVVASAGRPKAIVVEATSVEQEETREPFAVWTRRRPLKVALATLGFGLSFLPHPATSLLDWDAAEREAEAVAVITADDEVCWEANVGRSTSPEGCGSRRLEVTAFGQGMTEAERQMAGDYKGEFSVTVTKVYRDAVNDKLLRVRLEVDGEVVDKGSTTLNQVQVDSVDD